MWPLIIFIGIGIFILIAFEIRARKAAKDAETAAEEADKLANQNNDSECCGQHLVCEREMLLNTKPEIIYYDDEELDELAGLDPNDFTDQQYEAIASVFHSLKEKDVAGWVKSLQLRNITLPMDLREEALFIVVERRARSAAKLNE